MKGNFHKIINGNTPVLVDFFATWCGPCKMQTPILQQLASQIGDSARIVKIDVDANQAIAAKFNIRSVPTLAIFKNGKEVWRKAGVSQAKELQAILQKFQ